MNDPIHRIPDENKINAMIDMIHEGEYKAMLKDVNKQLKKNPHNQFWKAMKAYTLAYLGQLEEANEINNNLVKEEVVPAITVSWILYGFRATKNMEGYSNAVKTFYEKDPTNEDRINERYFIAQLEEDYVLQQTLINELIKKNPKEEKYVGLRMKLMASNPKTRIMAKMMLNRSHQKKGEVMMLLNILKEENNYIEMIKLLEENMSTGIYCRFEQRENCLIIMELLEKVGQFELIPKKVMSYLEEFNDEDYSAYTSLLHSLKHLKEEERNRYIELIEKRKEMKFNPSMKRSVYLFLIEYQIAFGNKEDIQKEVLNYLKEFNQLRLCASDVIPKLSKEIAQQLIDLTKEFPIFNAQLKLKCEIPISKEEIDDIKEETPEKKFVEVCSLIQDYQATSNRNSLFRCIEICEDELKKCEDEHEFHMLEVKCYELLGMREEAVTQLMHSRMDIKDVLLESLGYLIFTKFFALGTNDKYESIVKKYYNFHKDHIIYLKDNYRQAVDAMNWEEFDDLFEFEGELKKSSLKVAVDVFEILRQLQDVLVHSFENGKFLKPKCIEKIQKVIKSYRSAPVELIDNSDRSAYFTETFCKLPIVEVISPFYDIERGLNEFTILKVFDSVLCELQNGKEKGVIEEVKVEGNLNQLLINGMKCIVQGGVEEGNQRLKLISQWLNEQGSKLSDEQFIIVKRNILLTIMTIGFTNWLLKKTNSFNQELKALLSELKKSRTVESKETDCALYKQFANDYCSQEKEIRLIIERLEKMN